MDEGILNRVRGVVGLDRVSTRIPDLQAYSHDLWPRVNVLRLAGRPVENRPAAVAWPADAAQVSELVRICAAEGIPVVPYGAGSGVCGGAVPAEGGLVIDLKRLNRLVGVDELSMTAVVDAGINGLHFEEMLNERGFTLGHFPSSIMCSTVGGWIACRSAGQYSSRFGKIEDMVRALDVVLPDGTLVHVDATQTHFDAPDLAQLILGSEGTLGIVTRAWLRISPAPAARRFAAFRYLDLSSGLEAMRNIMQHGIRPSVMRLYDPLDTLLNSLGRGHGAANPKAPPDNPLLQAALTRILGEDVRDLGAALTGPMLRQLLSHPALLQVVLDRLPLSCLLVLGFEGEEARTREELAQATDMATRATGRDLGPGPGEHWYRHRYDVSFKLSKIFGQGAFAETVEVAGVWRDVARIYESVHGALSGRVAVMAHFSHAYREGCAVYFTVAGASSSPRSLPDLYDWTVKTAVTRAMRAGASLSHHHGVGIMKRIHTPEEYKGGDRLFWAVKEALDPACVLNPQKVYPTSVPVERDPEIPDDGPDFGSLLSWEHRAHGTHEVAPEVPEEIPELMRLARRTGRHLVCQGAPAEPGRRDPKGIRLNLKQLDQILDMDPVSGTVTVQAGITLVQLENFLREKGFSLGFIPRSLLRLTAGDYLATAAPGAGSPLYGTVRENCIGLSAILCDGTPFEVHPCPRRAAGPDLMHCLIGARGRYGVITAAVFRVFPLPVLREAIAFGADDPVVAVSAVRTALVRGARPEWVLVVVRAPNTVGTRRRVRTVLQLGGSRHAVSADLAVIRQVMEPLGMDPEPVRTEDRMAPPPRKAPSVERFLAMDEVMQLAERLGRADPETRPEAHVTHFSMHGATFRLLLREEGHRYPEDLLALLAGPAPDPVVTAAADRLKRELDPEGVLNVAPAPEVGT